MRMQVEQKLLERAQTAKRESTGTVARVPAGSRLKYHMDLQFSSSVHAAWFAAQFVESLKQSLCVSRSDALLIIVEKNEDDSLLFEQWENAISPAFQCRIRVFAAVGARGTMTANIDMLRGDDPR